MAERWQDTLRLRFTSIKLWPLTVVACLVVFWSTCLPWESSWELNGENGPPLNWETSTGAGSPLLRAGLGFESACSRDAETYLNTTETNKAGSAAGTTLLTLLPAILTFTPLPTADMRELMYVSPTAAYLTASMMFALPVSQKSLHPTQRIFSAANLLNSGEYEPGSLRALLLARTPSSVTVGKESLYLVGFIFLQLGLQNVLFNQITLIQPLQFIWVCESVNIVYKCWLWLASVTSAIALTLYESPVRREYMLFFLRHREPSHEAVSESLEAAPESDVDGYRCLSVRDTFGSLLRNFKLLITPTYGHQLFSKDSRALFKSSLKHPMPTCVVLQLSEDCSTRHGSRALRQLIAGSWHAFMFLSLTAIFGSAFRLRWLHTWLFVFAFLGTTIASRAASIWYLSQLQSALDLKVVECVDEAEMASMAYFLTELEPETEVRNVTDAHQHLAKTRHVPGQVRKAGNDGLIYLYAMVIMLSSNWNIFSGMWDLVPSILWFCSMFALLRLELTRLIRAPPEHV